MFCYPTDGLKPGGGELVSGILQYIALAFKTSTCDNEHISPIPWHFVISCSRLKRTLGVLFMTNTRDN